MLLQTYLEVSLPPATCNARRLRYNAVHLGSTVRLGGSGARRLQHGRAGGPTPPAAAVDSPDAVQQDRLRQQQQEQLPVNWAALDEELLACCGARARRWCGIQDAGVQLPAHTTVSPQWSMPPACPACTNISTTSCMNLKIARSWPHVQPSWHQSQSITMPGSGFSGHHCPPVIALTLTLAVSFAHDGAHPPISRQTLPADDRPCRPCTPSAASPPGAWRSAATTCRVRAAPPTYTACSASRCTARASMRP